MKHLNLKIFGFSVAICALSTFSVAAAPASNLTSNPFGQQSTERIGRQFRGQKPFTVDAVNHEVFGRQTPVKANALEPEITFSNIPEYDYLEGPDGTTWFYTTKYNYEKIVHNEYWTEEQIKGFEFTIYNSMFEPVGVIKDDVTFLEGEVRAREVLLDPAVSKNFFNNDDKYEVMVFFVMNTEPYYINHYYYKVYSVDGEKDENGNDVCLMTFEGRCVDATNVSSDPSTENYYYTFIKDAVVAPEYIGGKADNPEYVEYVKNLTNDLTTYSKAVDENGPKVVLEYSFKNSTTPGDTTDGIYLISKLYGGDLYFIFSHYELPYFVNPVGGAEDESATANNNFVIENYRISGAEPELLSTTKIPVDNPSTAESLIYSFFSIGSVNWSNDVDMVKFGTPAAPAYIVAHDVAKAATMEDISSDYNIYGNDGKVIRNIASNTESIAVFNGGIGEQPQAMFIKVGDAGDYVFEFANLYDGQPLFTINQQNRDENGTPDPLTATCDRMKADDGSYMYAFEMAYYTTDEAGNTYARVAWFDDQGDFNHTDYVNMGQDVQYGMVNIAAAVLNPYLYDDDDEMEYCALVKRTVPGGTTRNEFVVADHDGSTYATFTADDGLGDPFLYTIIPGEPNRIMMVYQSKGYNVALYTLPFTEEDKSGVESIVLPEEKSSISYDGATIAADGATIEVYSPAGLLVAKGFGAVSTDKLADGIYVAVAKDAAGAKSAIKISVK